jgi:hypothetical protein
LPTTKIKPGRAHRTGAEKKLINFFNYYGQEFLTKKRSQSTLIDVPKSNPGLSSFCVIESKKRFNHIDDDSPPQHSKRTLIAVRKTSTQLPLLAGKMFLGGKLVYRDAKILFFHSRFLMLFDREGFMLGCAKVARNLPRGGVSRFLLRAHSNLLGFRRL